MDEDSFLKCIVDPNRRAILQAIGGKERCVNDIITITGLEQSLVSFHLRSLRTCGLVTCRRDGKSIFYKLSNLCIMDVFSTIECIIEALNSRGDILDECGDSCDCE